MSDGNGGAYIRRTTVEKLAWTVAGSVGTCFMALVSWIGIEVYKEIRSTHDTMILLGSQLRAVAEQSASNAVSIERVDGKVEAHDRWAKEQRTEIEHRQDEFDRELRRHR